MLKHPYLLSFCILGAALGAMTYITRHPELWLERAHEAELRAACERMDRALERSVIEIELQYGDVKEQNNEMNKFRTIFKEERNGDLRRVTWWRPEDKDSVDAPWCVLYDLSEGEGVHQAIMRGDKFLKQNYQELGTEIVPIPYFSRRYSPYSYEILDALQEVKGKPCVVLRLYEDSKNFTDVYLDPSIGYMPHIEIRHRSVKIPDSENTNITEYHFEDYREIADKVFLPFSYRKERDGLWWIIGETIPEGGHIPRDEKCAKILSVNLNPEFKAETFAFIGDEAPPINDDNHYQDAKGLYHRIGRLFQ